MHNHVNLTIDRGNSLTKLAVWQNDELVATECFDHADLDSLADMASSHHIDHAMVCSVATPPDDLLEALRPVVPSVTALTCETPLPITIGYETPSTLGADRVAAAAGAATLLPGRNLLVVDAGTAVTYDHVTAEGCFAGGNIAPGIGMRLKALHSFTARLPQVEAVGEVAEFGRTTAEAMRAGAVNGVVAELLYYRSLLPPDTVVVLGGGDAPLIGDRIPFRIVRQPNLVTIGLNSIINYNETL